MAIPKGGYKQNKAKIYSKPTGTSGLGTRIDNLSLQDKEKVQAANAQAGINLARLGQQNRASQAETNALLGQQKNPEQAPLEEPQLQAQAGIPQITPAKQSLLNSFLFGPKAIDPSTGEQFTGFIGPKGERQELIQGTMPLAPIGNAAAAVGSIISKGGKVPTMVTDVAIASNVAKTGLTLSKSLKFFAKAFGAYVVLSKLELRDSEGDLTMAVTTAETSIEELRSGTRSYASTKESLDYIEESINNLERALKIDSLSPLSLVGGRTRVESKVRNAKRILEELRLQLQIASQQGQLAQAAASYGVNNDNQNNERG